VSGFLRVFSHDDMTNNWLCVLAVWSDAVMWNCHADFFVPCNSIVHFHHESYVVIVLYV